MPRVGGKHFPYTPAGEAAAASEAARTASPLVRDSYRHGGSIDMYGGGGKVKKKTGKKYKRAALRGHRSELRGG